MASATSSLSFPSAVWTTESMVTAPALDGHLIFMAWAFLISHSRGHSMLRAINGLHFLASSARIAARSKVCNLTGRLQWRPAEHVVRFRHLSSAPELPPFRRHRLFGPWRFFDKILLTVSKSVPEFLRIPQ